MPNSLPGSKATLYKYQLAEMYGVSMRTFHRWLKNAEVKVPRGYIKPKALQEIIAKIGDPDTDQFD